MTPSHDMDKLNEVIVTVQDRQDFLMKIKTAQEALFSSTGRPLSDVLSELFTPDTKTVLEAIIQSSQDPHIALEEIRSTLVEAPVIRLIIAFEPTPELLKKMAHEVREARAGNLCILDVQVDESIIGGVIISEGGTMTDRSLLKKIRALDTAPLLHKFISSLNAASATMK